jgi:hypothetical protein
MKSVKRLFSLTLLALVSFMFVQAQAPAVATPKNTAHLGSKKPAKIPESSGTQALPSHAESITVQTTANYTAPQGCVMVVSGSSGATTICPRADTGTAARSDILTDPQPCAIHLGTADASISRTRYCTDVARETPE